MIAKVVFHVEQSSARVVDDGVPWWKENYVAQLVVDPRAISWSFRGPEQATNDGRHVPTEKRVAVGGVDHSTAPVAGHSESGQCPSQRRVCMDHRRLEFLDPIQKLGCWYCGYANGLLHYALRIAAQTEEIFCPIQHQPGGGFHPPAHHADFAPYGDRKGFEARWAKWHDPSVVSRRP